MKHYLGIDLGGTNIAVGVLDESLQMLAKYSTPTLSGRGFARVVADMADATHKALEGTQLTLDDIETIGIGTPGTVDPATRRVIFANNLGWRDADIIGEFQKHIDKPVCLANDADCAALGEVMAGDMGNEGTSIMLTLGTGVGSGVVIDGQIYNGGTGFGCEIGHMVIEANGEPCSCGRRGCLESYASVTALIRDTIRAIAGHPESLMREMCGGDISKVNGRLAWDAMRQGDAAAKAVVDRYIDYLALGISNLSVFMRPDVYIIGGGVSNEGENLLVPLRARVEALDIYESEFVPQAKIVKAKFGNDAGIIGAALLGERKA